MELKTDKFRETLKKERKKVCILVALVAVFLYVWLPLMSSSGEDAPVPVVAAPAAAAPVPAGSAPARTTGEEVARATPENRDPPPYPSFLKVPLPARMLPRNPFVQLGPSETPEPVVKKDDVPLESPAELLRKEEMRKAESMVVTSIMRSGGTPCCVVDGTVLSVGSLHKGFRIVEIGNQNVRFSGKAGDYTISVKQPIKFAPQKDDK